MVEPYYQLNDPKGACDRLVDESYKKWKKQGNVVDDINCIVIFLGK